MSSGKYRRQITFQQKTSTVDADGFEKDTWADYATVYAAAKIVPRGREFQGAGATEVKNELELTVRYRDDLTSDMRVVYQGRVYHIMFIDDVEWKHHEMMLRVLEVVPGA